MTCRARINNASVQRIKLNIYFTFPYRRLMTQQDSQRKPHKFYVCILILLTLWMSVPGIASMQVIDRDEARYAQATVQMVESGDYLNIRFQDRARNKKPAGIYWMQAAFVKAFTEPGERKIWTHRIVSVLGALLAVLATYWGAISVLGRRGAFWSAAILATSLLMAFEAHIAKTDAMLCGFSSLCLACLLRLQKQPNKSTAFIFWIALGCAIMIKGPIAPTIIILAIIAYSLWQKETAWLKSLFNLPGIIAAILLVIPWMIAIHYATDGAFFKDAIGGDLAPKLAGAAEKHGAPPGYYALTLPVFFWPGILLLLPGIIFAKMAAGRKSTDPALKRAIRFLICWVIPFWLILEITPTKLPNYPLPLYPALSIFCAGAFSVLLGMDAFKKTRRVSSVVFFIIALLLILGVFAADGRYAEVPTPLIVLFPVLIGLALAGAIFMWAGKAHKGLIAALVLTGFLTPLTYGHIFPRLTDLRIGVRSSDTLTAQNIESPRSGKYRILSPNFTEPSLVYNLGTGILLGDKADKAIDQGLRLNDVVLIDERNSADHHSKQYLSSKINSQENCLIQIFVTNGFNYSKGDEVELNSYRVEACERPSSP